AGFFDLLTGNVINSENDKPSNLFELITGFIVKKVNTPNNVKNVGVFRQIRNLLSDTTTRSLSSLSCDTTLYFSVGDSGTYQGHTIVLVNVGSTSSVFDVGGTSAIINTGSSDTINGIEITVDAVYDRTNLDESAADFRITCDASCCDCFDNYGNYDWNQSAECMSVSQAVRTSCEGYVTAEGCGLTVEIPTEPEISCCECMDNSTYDWNMNANCSALSQDYIDSCEMYYSSQGCGFVADSICVDNCASKYIPLGIGLSFSNLFDRWIQDDDIPSLFDGEIYFQGDYYDMSEELQLEDQTNPLIATSLTSGEDDYGSNIYLEVTTKDKIRFAYQFDENINLSQITTQEPLTIEFLGLPLEIIDIISDSEFTINSGESYYMLVGESVIVENKTVTLVNVGCGSASIDVDGTTEIIGTGATDYIENLEITVNGVIVPVNLSEPAAAQLLIGESLEMTYSDGDAYLGEDENDPNWVWDISNLNQEGTDQILRIENDFIYDGYEDEPHALGDCITLPNSYLDICFNSLTVTNSDYVPYIFEYDSSVDFSDVFPSLTSVPAIHVQSQDLVNGLKLRMLDLVNYTTNQNVEEFWLYRQTGTSASVEGSTPASGMYVDVFFKDSSNNMKWMGAIDTSLQNNFSQVNYGNTVDENIQFKLSNSDSETVEFILNIVGDTTDELDEGVDDMVIIWTLDSSNGEFNSLGTSQATAEENEFTWGTSSLGLGTKDEDHRSNYGIIIKDPASNSLNDKVELEIPIDQVKAEVIIWGQE
ncbi:MAG: hypothetical protein ABIF40_03665, partial [archaeon]